MVVMMATAPPTSLLDHMPNREDAEVSKPKVALFENWAISGVEAKDQPAPQALLLQLPVIGMIPFGHAPVSSPTYTIIHKDMHN